MLLLFFCFWQYWSPWEMKKIISIWFCYNKEELCFVDGCRWLKLGCDYSIEHFYVSITCFLYIHVTWLVQGKLFWLYIIKTEYTKDVSLVSTQRHLMLFCAFHFSHFLICKTLFFSPFKVQYSGRLTWFGILKNVIESFWDFLKCERVKRDYERSSIDPKNLMSN